MYITPKQVNLAVVQSQITPGAIVAGGGCDGIFPKWRLSQKLRGAEPSISTLFIGFVGRRLQRKYCRFNHAIVSAILEAILKNGGHFQSNTSISETKRRRTFKVDSMYRFCGASISETYCRYIMKLYPPFWRTFVQNGDTFPK